MTHSMKLSRRQVLLSAAGATFLGFGPRPSQAEPRRGGRLRAGLSHGATTDVIDPAKCDNGFTQTIVYALFNGLTEAGPKGELLPGLAESWEAAPTASTWHFKLREGVTFHNGQNLTPQDVIASINRHRGPDSTSGAKGILTSIQDIKADGPRGVIFTLAEPNADFPFILSDFHLGILPVKNGAVDATSPIGTGSYELVEFNPGVRALLKRSPTHWRTDRGYFDEVELLTIIDATARTNSLLAGEVDVINSCDPKTAEYLKANTQIAVDQA